MSNSQKTENQKLKINFGFTLVELLIAVTLSALLMTSVMIFTGSSIRNSKTNEKLLTNYNKNSTIEIKLLESINNIDVNGIYSSGSSYSTYLTGIFLSTKLPNLPITFIGMKTFTGFCDSFSPSASATGTINKLVIKELIGNSIAHSGTTNYYIDFAKNSIYTSGGTLTIGTLIKGNNFDSSSPTATELNNPSAIIEDSNILYIADSGNNRILGLSGSTLYEILGEKDGINNPTDIYYSGALYIANAGAGNIIKVTDGKGSGSILDITFKVPKDITFDKIEFTSSGISSFTSPTASGSFTFSGIDKTSSDIVNSGGELSYNFSGTGEIINSGTTYGIKINNLANYPTNTGSYSMKINFLSGSDLKESLNFPYFTKGDGDILTKNGNIVEILTGGLRYPNNITSTTSRSGAINNYSNLLDNSFGKETISELPIKNFEYILDGSILNGSILNLKVNYYKYYDCINEKHIIKEKIYKKYLN